MDGLRWRAGGLAVRRLPAAAALLALLIGPAQPALGYDDLEEVLPAIPTSAPSGALLFSYAERALSGRRAELGVGGKDIILALARPERSLPLTGIDLSFAESVFVTGDRTAPVHIINGRSGFTEGAERALTARSFVRLPQTTAAGTLFFARGDDEVVDARVGDANDPFGGEEGRAQRLAIDPSRVIVTSSTDALQNVVSALTDRPACAVCDRFRRIVDTIRATAGAQARLKDVQGYLSTAFLVPREEVVALSSEADFRALSDSILKPRLMAIPLFDVAMLGELEHKGAVRPFIALSYADRKAAEKGIAEVAKRLKSGRSSIRGQPSGVVPTEVDVTVVDRTGGVVALAIATFPKTSGKGIFSVFQRWSLDIASRDFFILDFLK